jgi:hypothetical protein
MKALSKSDSLEKYSQLDSDSLKLIGCTMKHSKMCKIETNLFKFEEILVICHTFSSKRTINVAWLPKMFRDVIGHKYEYSVNRINFRIWN